MTRLVLGPFSRVEGDLEIRLDMDGEFIARAEVVSPLYRGFERILMGKSALDALVIAPRICGICSVAQSVAAARALSQIAGLELPENGKIAQKLALMVENAADHLTHFAFFFMPDFAHSAYQDRAWFDRMHQRFAAPNGEAHRQYAAARARFLHLMGIMLGKWPHSLALQPGGTTKGIDASEKMRALAILAEFREFLETHTFGMDLEEIAWLGSADQLQNYAEKYGQTDFGLFLNAAFDLGLNKIGLGPKQYMSSGVASLWPAGTWDHGRAGALDHTGFAEDISHSHMKSALEPELDKPGAYSWCKAPRLDGKPVEVGAFARQLVAHHPLAQSLWDRHLGSCMDRVVMRLVELAGMVLIMEKWIKALTPRADICTPFTPQNGQSTGLAEAARGTLSHHVSLEDGIITAYQIIAPTTWNFSPRDRQGQPGPLEQALSGLPHIPGQAPTIYHVIRSFDPCMACTVH